MNLGVVSLAFRCHPITDEPRPSDEAITTTWVPVEKAVATAHEARAIRIMDAFRDDGPFVRCHDGTVLLHQP